MPPFIKPLVLASTLALATLPAAAQTTSMACISGPNQEGDVSFWACVTNGEGFQGSGNVARVGDWGVAGSSSGTYRTGDWSNVQEANLATGVMRASLLYASGEDTQEYQLGNYTDLYDELTFSGNGSAEFVMRLSGAFLGTPHLLYGNTMDTALDFYSPSRRTDALGRIHLGHKEAGEPVSFMPGTTCGATHFQLGQVSCTVLSLEPGGVAIDLHVRIDGITDGEVLQFRSALNVQAYGPRMGGSDFGHTARLGVVALNGVSFTSASGAFLTQATPVPEPGSWALMCAGLLLGLGRLQRMQRPQRA
jgi:hypothetical protein